MADMIDRLQTRVVSKNFTVFKDLLKDSDRQMQKRNKAQACLPFNEIMFLLCTVTIDQSGKIIALCNSTVLGLAMWSMGKAHNQNYQNSILY